MANLWQTNRKKAERIDASAMLGMAAYRIMEELEIFMSGKFGIPTPRLKRFYDSLRQYFGEKVGESHLLFDNPGKRFVLEEAAISGNYKINDVQNMAATILDEKIPAQRRTEDARGLYRFLTQLSKSSAGVNAMATRR